MLSDIANAAEILMATIAIIAGATYWLHRKTFKVCKFCRHIPEAHENNTIPNFGPGTRLWWCKICEQQCLKENSKLWKTLEVLHKPDFDPNLVQHPTITLKDQIQIRKYTRKQAKPARKEERSEPPAQPPPSRYHRRGRPQPDQPRSTPGLPDRRRLAKNSSPRLIRQIHHLGQKRKRNAGSWPSAKIPTKATTRKASEKH